MARKNPSEETDIDHPKFMFGAVSLARSICDCAQTAPVSRKT
jgi:hypothetical protein